MAYHIIPAIPSDAPDLAALHAQALPPGWPATGIAAFCGAPNRAVLKAVGDPAAAGTGLSGLAIVQFAADEAELLSIAVAPDSVRRGIASQLTRAAICLCEEKLISCMYLEVAEHNSPGRKLYEKFGFRQIARRENYYQAPKSAAITALIMRLDIRRGLPQIVREADGAH